MTGFTRVVTPSPLKENSGNSTENPLDSISKRDNFVWIWTSVESEIRHYNTIKRNKFAKAKVIGWKHYWINYLTHETALYLP